MKTLTQVLAQEAMSQLEWTDKLPVQSKKSSGILIGFSASIDVGCAAELLNEKLNKVCENHFKFQALVLPNKEYMIKIVAKSYLVDQGGIFQKTVLSLIDGLVCEQITFKKVNNLYL